MIGVADAVKELDVRRSLLGKVKQMAQTDNITEELDGHIEKLSLLVNGLMVCQLALGATRTNSRCVH